MLMIVPASAAPMNQSKALKIPKGCAENIDLCITILKLNRCSMFGTQRANMKLLKVPNCWGFG